MVSTFISLLDIQSWWEIPCIAHFCSLFSSAFDLPDIDIEDLESALLTDGTEESVGLLPELIVRILKGCDLLRSNRDEITTSNYQMFLRRFLRHQCRKNDVENYFDTDTDFSSLPVRNKLLILHSLCHFRLESTDVYYKFNNLEADSLRVEPLGFDSKNSGYWYFFGTRLYREDIKSNSKDTIWQVICFTEEDWQNLSTKLKSCKTKKERALLKILEENFLPKLPQLFLERERLRRRKLFQNRNSARIRAADNKYKDLHEKQDLERIEREKYEEQLKLAEATNKKRRRSRSESSGSGVSTYASSIRPSLNSSDFLCKREKFCLSPDLGASSVSPPPASLIHNHAPLFPPTPSQSPTLEKNFKSFNDIVEYEAQHEDIENEKFCHTDLTHIEGTVTESKIFLEIKNQNNLTPRPTCLKDQRDCNFTPESVLRSDIKSNNSSNCFGYSDEYDDATSLISFDEDKENLICYKRSDTESEAESNNYYCNSPTYCNIVGAKSSVDTKLEEKINNMAPITSSTTVKLPGRQTNNSLSSISENIFLPTFETTSALKKNIKTGKTGKKEMKATKTKPSKIEKVEKSAKKTKNSTEKSDKIIEKNEAVESENPHKKKKARNSESFTETDEVLQIGMHKVLVYVKNHRDAWPFMDPVEEDIAPRYYSIIRRPMDLLKMEDKLDNGEYKKFSEFRNDFKLIVNNCRLYNGQNNEYTEMVNNLQEAFDKATKKYFDNLSDEEDEIGYPESKLNVFREKYFNKNSSNEEEIDKIASNAIIKSIEKDNKDYNMGDTDEEDSKFESKNKISKRKHKDKDKRRKKKIKLDDTNSIKNDDTDEEEYIDEVRKLDNEKDTLECEPVERSGPDDFEDNVKGKNKKGKKITEISKSKKKAESKQKDKDKYRKQKEDHANKDVKHKSKTKDSEKSKEANIKKHTKKVHCKTKNYKEGKEAAQYLNEIESDVKPIDDKNIENLSNIESQNSEVESNIYDFDTNEMSEKNVELKNKTRKHGIKDNKKTDKMSKNKKGKENQLKSNKSKSVKNISMASDLRSKKKGNTKLKKDKPNTKYSDDLDSSNEDSEVENKMDEERGNIKKETFFSDSSRSPTPNFKIDLHKKYANTLTPTKSASLESHFSNDNDENVIKNDHDMEDDDDEEIQSRNIDGLVDKQDENTKTNEKKLRKNTQKRNKDFKRKNTISKSENCHKSKDDEIDLNTKSTKNRAKRIKAKFKSATHFTTKSKVVSLKKSKKKVSKISEEKRPTRNETEETGTSEDVISNQNQSLRSRSQSPSASDFNEKSFKHRTKLTKNKSKGVQENRKQNDPKGRSKKKAPESTDSDVESSDEEENNSTVEKDANNDMQTPLFLDKYDLIKQRRRCAALNSKKEEDKVTKLCTQNDKNKTKKGKCKTNSNKNRSKAQKSKQIILKARVRNDKNKDRKMSIEEICDPEIRSEENEQKEDLENLQDKNCVEKSTKQMEKNLLKKSQSDSGKTKYPKSQNNMNIITEAKDNKGKETKSKENKQKEVKPLKKKECSDNKLSEQKHEVVPGILGSPLQNKKSQLKKQQILESLSTSLSSTSNLINKKKGKNTLGTPPVAIVAPTQSLNNSSLIKCDSATNKATNMEALELETEQTLKDINRWLEHTPRFSEFSSASNSPNRYNLLDDFDAVAAKLDPADFRRPGDGINAGAVNGSVASVAKNDSDSKLIENLNETKKSSHDNKLIGDLIPVTAVSNKVNILNSKELESQNLSGTNVGTHSGMGTSIGGSSSSPINHKSKEPNTTQLLPHPPPPPPHIKNQLQKEAKRKSLKEKLSGAGRRKDLLRTIDRLHPGKSKGNLLTNVHNTNKPEEIFPLGTVSKVKEVKNSLVVETDESAPKLSLGSVLNTSGFGLGQLHNFGDEIASNDFKISEAITLSEESENTKKNDLVLEKSEKPKENPDENAVDKGCLEEMRRDETKPFQCKKEESHSKTEAKLEDGKPSSATPNLSAWFKAFGAPKKTKKLEDEEEKKKMELIESGTNNQNTSEDPSTSPNKNLKSPAQSGQDNFSLPAPRQRKASTGSTVSERSSYSHDPDSPRIGIDDRFGPYPGSYASPIGASPIMVSPKPDEPSKPTSPYPLNGTIKVGFYQDTTTKSSPEKSCSPRELPSPAYAQYSQHIYSGNSPNINTSTDTASPGTAAYGTGNNQTGNSATNGSSAYNINNDQKKTPSSSSFSPRSPVQPPTPTLYEQYKQPQSQESDYNSSMSPSTNPNSPYQQPQSSPYQHSSSSPYHQSSNPNSPYQQPHSPFSNQQGQSGQGPPSSGPPSAGSMHIVTNSPNHPNGESPRGQNSPYQQQMNSPYQQSDHSSPYNQNHNPTSPYQQSSSPAHSSVVPPSQQSSQSNTQTKTNFTHSPILNLENATPVLEKHQIKLQKSENENIYGGHDVRSSDENLKSVGNQNANGSNPKLQNQSPVMQHGNLNQGQQNIIQPHQVSQSQPQQLVSQIAQSPHYHTTHSQVQNQNQVPGGAYESNAIVSNTVLSQEMGQISNQPSDQVPQTNSSVTDKNSLDLQYTKYPQYNISSNSDKSSNQCSDFVSDLSLQLASKQTSINVPNSQTQISQQQKQQNQQQLHQSLQRPMNSQNLHQSPHNIQTPQSQQTQQQHQQQNSSHNIQQPSQQVKRNYESSTTALNVNYAQQNQNANEMKNLKSDEKQLLLHQQQQREHHQQQNQEQSQSSQQQSLYDSATINKHHQMFDGFLSSMTAAKNIGFNKSLDITSSKAYEVLNKAAAMGFSSPIVQAAAAAAMSNKDNLQQHQPIIPPHVSQQQKNENLSNLYSQPLAQVNNNNRINLSHQSQPQQPQQQQQQSSQQTQQLQQQRQHQNQRSQQSQQHPNSHNQQSSAIPLYGGSKSSHNMPSASTPYGSQNVGQRNENNSSELISNSLNRNLDLSNYKTSSSYQNSSNIIDHTMRHHSTLTQMMDDTSMLGLQNNTPGAMSTSYYDKNVPPAAHMFSKNLPQQLYQNSSTIYGGRDQQNLPPPGNYVPQSNQSSSNTNNNGSSQVEQIQSAPSVDQKQTKRSKKKKITELVNLNQSTISHQSSTPSIQQQPQNLQLQQHQQQDQQQMLNNSSQNTANTSGNITQNVTSAHQGFQLYAGLKTAAAVVAASSSANQTISGSSNNSPADPSAISLKTAAAAASMVSGSAFNFGPSPTGLPLPSGLYGDNSTYLEEFRNANPYYIPPTHHRVPQDSTNNPTQTSVSEKSQSPTINNNTAPTVASATPSPYHQFLTAAAHPATQRGSYPFMNSPQLDPNSPLYTQYLRPDEFRARMMQNLSQSLLPPGAGAGYPQTGYRPTLGMPKPYDMNNRQPWF